MQDLSVVIAKPREQDYDLYKKASRLNTNPLLMFNASWSYINNTMVGLDRDSFPPKTVIGRNISAGAAGYKWTDAYI